MSGRGPIGGLVNLIGEGIGLAHEAYASRKQRAARKQASRHSTTIAGPSTRSERSITSPVTSPVTSPPPYDSEEVSQRVVSEKKRDPDEESIGTDPGSDALSDDEDETDWIYDDVQENANANDNLTKASFTGTTTVDDIVKTFVAVHPPRPSGNRMPSPVVLPQRRPKTRRRGFIRGYAPCLELCGVDQTAFMDFLAAFDRAVDIAPWNYTVNLAMVAAHATPQLSEALAVQVSRESERRLHMAGEPSTFVNKLNAAYFQPNGLHCFIMSWKPYSPHYSENLNMSKGELQVLMSNDKNKRTLMGALRGDTGKAKMVELPRAAELIFPNVEQLTYAEKKESAAKTESFYKDYADRVAQARFNRKNPTSPFATEPKFASRYSDPNHPARSGSLLALITGGALHPNQRADHQRELKRERRAYRDGYGYDTPEHLTPVHGPAPKQPVPLGPIGLASYPVQAANRALKQDVLYLMIVNMPSAAELEDAKLILERGPPPEYA